MRRGMRRACGVNALLACALAAAIPRPLPAPWVQCEADGDVYYHNKDTGESVWERPEATSMPASPSGQDTMSYTPRLVSGEV